MANHLAIFDFTARGIACGVLLTLAICMAFSRGVPQRTRLIVSLTLLSTMTWLITKSAPVWALFGSTPLLLVATMPVPGLFWLTIRTIFDDSPPRWLDWMPAAYLLVIGVIADASPPPLQDALWFVSNVSAILIAAHAGYLVFRGRRDDLVERRQRLRVVVLGLFAVFGVWEGVIFLIRPLVPGLFVLFVSQPYGVALIGMLLLAAATLFLEARPDLFGPPMARVVGETGAITALQAQARAEAADQILLEKLGLAMEAGVWRREGLTIGSLAEELGVHEHRLRRLINNRMGHRNFSEFLNGRRIEQAKARLSDRATAHLTVAEIAFDLGYGSLGPFNRAFRAATGVTPTAWRAEALKTSPNS